MKISSLCVRSALALLFVACSASPSNSEDDSGDGADASGDMAMIPPGDAEAGDAPEDAAEVDAAEDADPAPDVEDSSDDSADAGSDTSEEDVDDARTDAVPDAPADVGPDLASDVLPDAADVPSDPDVERTCVAIEAEYLGLIGSVARCNESGVCHLLRGHCGAGLGGCYYATSPELAQTTLDDLSLEWVGNGCSEGRPICRCAAPPPVGCTGGLCELLF